MALTPDARVSWLLYLWSQWSLIDKGQTTRASWEVKEDPKPKKERASQKERKGLTVPPPSSGPSKSNPPLGRLTDAPAWAHKCLWVDKLGAVQRTVPLALASVVH